MCSPSGACFLLRPDRSSFVVPYAVSVALNRSAFGSRIPLQAVPAVLPLARTERSGARRGETDTRDSSRERPRGVRERRRAVKRESAPRERSGEGPGGERTRPRTRPERRALRPDPDRRGAGERETRERTRDDIIIKPHDTKVETTNEKPELDGHRQIFLCMAWIFSCAFSSRTTRQRKVKRARTPRARESGQRFYATRVSTRASHDSAQCTITPGTQHTAHTHIHTAFQSQPDQGELTQSTNPACHMHTEHARYARAREARTRSRTGTPRNTCRPPSAHKAPLPARTNYASIRPSTARPVSATDPTFTCSTVCPSSTGSPRSPCCRPAYYSASTPLRRDGGNGGLAAT